MEKVETITKELTEEEKEFIKKQEEDGKYMDKIYKHELFLRRNKKLFNENDDLILYKLPINEEARERLYNNIMKDLKEQDEKLIDEK